MNSSYTDITNTTIFAVAVIDDVYQIIDDAIAYQSWYIEYLHRVRKLFVIALGCDSISSHRKICLKTWSVKLTLSIILKINFFLQIVLLITNRKSLKGTMDRNSTTFLGKNIKVSLVFEIIVFVISEVENITHNK